MHKTLVVSTLAFAIGSAALAGGSIKSPCGDAALAKNTDNNGAVCVSVCSSGFSYNGCATAQATATPTPSEESPDPAPAIEYLSIRIYGDNLSVAELAAALERATGWTTDVPAGLRPEEIRPAKKRLSGSKSRSLRFRLKQGGKVLVSIDDEQKTLTVFRL